MTQVASGTTRTHFLGIYSRSLTNAERKKLRLSRKRDSGGECARRAGKAPKEGCGRGAGETLEVEVEVEDPRVNFRRRHKLDGDAVRDLKGKEGMRNDNNFSARRTI